MLIPQVKQTVVIVNENKKNYFDLPEPKYTKNPDRS